MFTKKIFRKSNFKALSIYLLIIGIVILVAQGLHINAGREIIGQVNESQVMIIREIASDMEYLVHELQEKLVTLARLYPLCQLEADEVIFNLRIFYELMHDQVSHIGIMNEQGKYEYLYPPIPRWQEMQLKDFSKTDFFQNAVNQFHHSLRQSPYISSQYEQGFGITAIPVSLPLYADRAGKETLSDDKAFLGVLVLFLDLAVIDNLCQNHYSHLHDYSSFWLVDEQGIILSHENKAWIGKKVFQAHQEKPLEGNAHSLNRIVRERMLRGETGTEFYYDHGPQKGPLEKYYLNYTPVQLPGITWSIAVTTPAIKMDHWERRVLKSAWQWLLFVISFILVALSFVQVVIILIHRKRIDWEKEQKEKFQSAFDGITDLVYMIDINYRLQIVNKAFIKICGQAEKEIEGKKCFQFIRERESPCPDCPIPKTKSTHQAQRLEQIIFQETANLYAYPLVNDEGETTATVIFARIITKEKMLEQELQHRERLSLLGKQAACIAHEIKNPLVGIGMLAELVHDSLPSESPAAEDLERILRECRRLEQLINNLSKFSRPAPLIFERGDIHKSLDLALALLRKRMKEHRVQLQTDYQTDIPSIIHDAQKMQQVFLNLIINSLNAMPGGGQLTIQTSLHPASTGGNGSQITGQAVVCIEIQDTGTGISPQVQKRIFEPFFSTSSKGTGLGLSIVHSIVQQHGGEIYLKSEPGKGTLMSINLPIEPRRSTSPIIETLPDIEHYQ